MDNSRIRISGRLDGKHTVFGEVVSGIEVVKKIEALGSASGKPKVQIVIQDCGEVSAEAK